MRKTYIKNLLSINKKAFQFLHDVEGFDFEKPYFITEQPGKFTAYTVKKAIAEHLNPAACKISVFVVPTASRCLRDLYFATLRLDKFSACRRDGVSYWNYRTAAPGLNIDYCFGVGDFEKLRKSETEKIYIIAQGVFITDSRYVEYAEIGLHYYKYDTLIKFFEDFKQRNRTKHILITFSKNHRLQCEPVQD